MATGDYDDAFIPGDGWDMHITEYWDTDGNWHDGAPSWDEVENGEVSGMTGHLEYEDGTEKYFDIDMSDQNELGFDYDEFYDEIDDAADRYSESN